MTSIATIIPGLDGFLQNQADWVLWVICVLAIALLAAGADRAVSAAVKLAAALGLSTVIIGATIVSLGTTTPEAVVSVRAALAGDGTLALSNGVGSIICDTALIFGLGCVLTRLPLNRFILNHHGWLQLGAGALLTAVAFGLWAISGDIGNVIIGRTIGLVFVGLLILYMYVSVRWAKKHPELIPDEAKEAEAVAPQRKRLWLLTLSSITVLAAGLGFIVLGSELLIGSVKEVAVRHNVPPAVLGVTVVALGTSLPELATAIASILKGHGELLIGNIIGADILNVLFVIGLSATAVPLRVEPVFFYLLLPVMMLSLILMRVFIYSSGKTFQRWHGLVLLGVYATFLVILISRFGVGEI